MVKRVTVYWSSKTPTAELWNIYYQTWADYSRTRYMLEHAGPEAGPQLGLDWIIADDLFDLKGIAHELRKRGYNPPENYDHPLSRDELADVEGVTKDV